MTPFKPGDRVTDTDLNDLEAKAKLAHKLLPPVPAGTDSQEFECAVCCGEGTIGAERIDEFDTEYAATVHVYGIGDSLENMKAYIQAANPARILALCKALRRAVEGLRYIEKTRGKRCVQEGCTCCQDEAIEALADIEKELRGGK